MTVNDYTVALLSTLDFMSVYLLIVSIVMLFFFCFLRQQRFSQERIAVLFVDFSLIFELLLLLLIVNSCSIVELVFLVHLQTLYVNCVRELFF